MISKSLDSNISTQTAIPLFTVFTLNPVTCWMKHQGADASVCIKITMKQTRIDRTEMRCFAISARIYTMAFQHVTRNQASVTTAAARAAVIAQRVRLPSAPFDRFHWACQLSCSTDRTIKLLRSLLWPICSLKTARASVAAVKVSKSAIILLHGIDTTEPMHSYQCCCE